jgi:hypothetical protein
VRKRGRGRPKKKWPAEVLDDLSSLRVFKAAGLRGKGKKMVLNCGGKRTVFPNGVQLYNTCKRLIDKYRAVRWIDSDSGEVVAEIKNAGTLRNEIMKAKRRGRTFKSSALSVTYTSTSTLMKGNAEVGSLVVAPFDLNFTSTAINQRRIRLVLGERILHRK